MLKSPQDSSYHYFNRDGGYYFQQAETSNQRAYSVYNSPPGDRYYNPSTREQEKGEYFIGIYWQTLKEKICFTDSRGSSSLTMRKHVDTTDLPERRVAVYINSLGMQRIVEVNDRGIYEGGNHSLLAEIRFWLAHNVPLDYMDGPRLVDDEVPQARLISPPPEDPTQSSDTFDDSYISGDFVKQESTSASNNNESMAESSTNSHPRIKQEVNSEVNLSNIRHSEPSSEARSLVVKREPDVDSKAVLYDMVAATTSAQKCRAKLSATRDSSKVHGAGVSKKVKPQQTATQRAILLRGEQALAAAQQSSESS